MRARGEIAAYWDSVLKAWQPGQVPDQLQEWFGSYRGRGRGQVVLEAIPEPYLGDLSGAVHEPAVVFLGLNPGGADLDFQGAEGTFVKQIKASSYSEWARALPYSSEQWRGRGGRDIYHPARLRFARTMLEAPELPAERVLTLELYPWHSTAVTGRMAAPSDVLERFVWQPLREIDVPFIYAFGKPWFDAAADLDLPSRTLDVAWDVESREETMYDLPSGQRLIVIAQRGYAGPPKLEDAVKLREVLRDLP